ncbi:MAG TPA: hypothetical protein VFM88_18475 [Vicinamibacteria bacterium]|nr:hypothetical protein [Vicinamibacteria bacterium]
MARDRAREAAATRSRGGPVPSRGLLSDVRHYLLHSPSSPTRIEFASPDVREEYGRRILQRLGVSVEPYDVLNIHRIGVDVPARYVFGELRSPEVATLCWPCHLAALERVGKGTERLRVYLLGRRGSLFGPLFQLDELQVQDRPDAQDVDSARFLLFSCSGGYPIGILSVYVRSSIPSQGEREQTQVFFLVSFNFYGKRNWPGSHLMGGFWEWIHNRVTSNILTRFKELCEARFEALRESGLADAEHQTRDAPAPSS